MLFMILFLTSFEENTVLAQEQCLLSSCPETATIAGLESMDESYSQMLLYILTEDTLITGDYSDLSNETSNLEKSTDQLIQSNKDQDQIISAIDHSIKDMNAKIDYLKKLTVKISKESDLLSQETETLTANATNLTQEGSKLSDEFSNLNNSFTQLAEKSSSLRSVIRKNALIDSEVIIEANECKWVEVNIDIAADAKLGNVFANLLRDGSPIAGGAGKLLNSSPNSTHYVAMLN